MRQLYRELLKDIPPETKNADLLAKIRYQNDLSGKIIIVLDDDPTGTQTVHGIPVVTSWDEETLKEVFFGGESTFFILTNTRAMDRIKAETVISQIMKNVIKASKECSRPYIIADRGDSTLRGHYPLETDTVRNCIERDPNTRIDADILVPCFFEGGRYTLDDIHWVEQDVWWVPAAETEFARDTVFGYKNSDLKKWVQDKTSGKYPAKEVVSISIEDIRTGGEDRILKKLLFHDRYRKIIVNAVAYSDLEVFSSAVIKAEKMGMNYIYRTAASFVRVRSGIETQKLLSKKEIVFASNNGALIIVGSYVRKASLQLENALRSCNVKGIEVNASKLIEEDVREAEIYHAAGLVTEAISQGIDCILYTSRALLKSNNSDPDEDLRISAMISDGLVQTVKSISAKPRYMMVKGGITSSDIATRALGIKKAKVLGQIRPGIPVWRTEDLSSYIIFPGNVGTEDDMKDIIKELEREN